MCGLKVRCWTPWIFGWARTSLLRLSDCQSMRIDRLQRMAASASVGYSGACTAFARS